MKKRMIAVLFAAMMTMTLAFGGCGETQETGGRAKRGSEQKEESEEAGDSGETGDSGESEKAEGSRESESDADEAGNVASDLLGLLEGDNADSAEEAEKWEASVVEEMERLDLYISREYDYDRFGNLTKSVEYSNPTYDGVVDVHSWSEWECDQSGTPTIEYKYVSMVDNEWYILERNEREYDQSGNMKKEVSYFTSGEVKALWEYEYEYDQSGNPTKGVKYFGGYENGEESERMEWEYDQSGNPTKKVVYRPNGYVKGQVEYEYDQSGNLTKSRIYKEKNLEYSEEREYDQSGNMTKVVWYNSWGKIEVYMVSRYDRAGIKRKTYIYDSVLGMYKNDWPWEEFPANL